MVRKTTAILLIIMLLSVIPAVHAHAAPNYTGTYMFTEKGNDKNMDTIEHLINQWFDEKGIVHEAELTYKMKLESDGHYNAGDDFSFDFSDNTKTSGLWHAGEPVSFYSVKAGNQYAMYWVDPTLSTGLFTTAHLTVGNGRNNPALSHITFWMDEDTYVPSSVPEPSTMVLFGLGLIGLAGISRRNHKKKS